MWDSPRSGLSCVNCAMSNSDADSADFVDEVGLGSAWYDPTAAAVSIIILNLNKSALTLQCLRQVWRHTEGHTYEIIVVDNGSKPEEFSKLADTPGLFKLIRLPVNRYFGEGNNIGVEASRGRYLVFLNNDAFVSKGWLEPLISTFENEPNAGGVGPRMVYPDGRLQEAGAFLDDVALSVQRGKFYRLTPWERETTMVVDYCSAACFLTTREIFDRVSGFDPIFEPAYYEDADLCFKIACLGLFVYCCPQVEIVHLESVTATDRDVAPILIGVIANNRDKFRARWQNYLSTREKTGIGSLPTLPPPRPRVADDAHHNLPLAVFHTPGHPMVYRVGRQTQRGPGSLLRESRIGERLATNAVGVSSDGMRATLLTIPGGGKPTRGFEGVGGGETEHVRLVVVGIERGRIDFGKAGSSRHWWG